jgi:hypothetical protein
MNLDPAGAAELAEALQFIAGWPGSDPARLAASLRGDGEDLFGTRETRPPA